MRKISYAVLLAVIALSACKNDSFKKGKNGMEYKFISDGNGQKIKDGDFMQIHVVQAYTMAEGKKDSIMSDTRDNGGPLVELMDSTSMPPEYYEILKQIKKGDSLIIRIPVDSLFAKRPETRPPFFKRGHSLITTIKMYEIFTTRQQADSARNSEMAIMAKTDSIKAIAVMAKDDSTLKKYFTKNNINVVKSPLGVYVEMIQPGTGNNIDTSVVVKTNYTGKTMDGVTFDSNTDPERKNRGPFSVNMTNDPSLGQGVIKGWTDGLKMLNNGAKAKFYIPSPLAYGSKKMGKGIAPNSILVFDIEVLDVLTREQAHKIIDENRQKQQHFSDSIRKVRTEQMKLDSMKRKVDSAKKK